MDSAEADLLVAEHKARRPCAFHMLEMMGSEIEPPLYVEGYMAVEVYSGVQAVTLGCEIHGVPCICPWDIMDGPHLDVVKNGEVLIRLAQHRRMRSGWIASPCQSLTLARSPCLRSFQFPYGLPQLSEREWKSVEGGNHLCSFAVRLCIALYVALSYFGLENPWKSFLWILNEVVCLAKLPGVIFTYLEFEPYGACYVKPTGFVA